MARDEGLEALLEDELTGEPDLVVKPMFGGRAWLLHGHLLCGARHDGILFRLGRGRDGWALAVAGVAPMFSRDRRMEGWVRATPEACGDDTLRRRLLDAALAFVATLSPK